MGILEVELIRMSDQIDLRTVFGVESNISFLDIAGVLFSLPFTLPRNCALRAGESRTGKGGGGYRSANQDCSILNTNTDMSVISNK